MVAAGRLALLPRHDAEFCLASAEFCLVPAVRFPTEKAAYPSLGLSPVG